MNYAWALLVISYQRWRGLVELKHSTVSCEARERWAAYENAKAAIYTQIETKRVEGESLAQAAGRLLSVPQVEVLELIKENMPYDSHCKVGRGLSDINNGAAFFKPYFHTDKLIP